MIYECPSCGKKLKIPDELVGKTVRCSDCAGTFTAEKPGPPAAPPRAPSGVPSEAPTDEEMRPSRRRRSEGGLEAHRGGMVLGFGIASLVLLFVLAPAGLVFGILAWMWGGADLVRIKGGYMDPSGQGMTQAGYICGIIGTILNAITVIVGCIFGGLVLAGFAAVPAFCCCGASIMPTGPVPPGPARPFPPPPPPGRPFPRSVPTPLKLAQYLPDRIAVIRP